MYFIALIVVLRILLGPAADALPARWFGGPVNPAHELSVLVGAVKDAARSMVAAAAAAARPTKSATPAGRPETVR